MHVCVVCQVEVARSLLPSALRDVLLHAPSASLSVTHQLLHITIADQLIQHVLQPAAAPSSAYAGELCSTQQLICPCARLRGEWDPVRAMRW